MSQTTVKDPSAYKTYIEYAHAVYGLRETPMSEAKEVAPSVLNVKKVSPSEIDLDIESFGNGTDFSETLRFTLEMYHRHYEHPADTPLNLYYTLEEDGLYRFYTQEEMDFNYHTMNQHFPECV